MANNFNVNSIIASEALRWLENESVFLNTMSRTYQDKFNLVVEDHRTGPTINIPKPAKFNVRSGWVRQAQNFVEETIPLTINMPRGIDVNMTDAELALFVDNAQAISMASKRFIKPRMVQLAQQIDAELYARMAVTVPNAVGTPGVTPQTFDVYSDASVKLDNFSCPSDDRVVIVNPVARGKTTSQLKGLFINDVASDALKKGKIGRLVDLDYYMSQHVYMHQVGAQGGTPLVDTASQTGSTLNTKGWNNNTIGALRKGDIFTIQGVYAVNRVTKATTGELQQFVVEADADTGGSGLATLQIFPAIITSGVNQTVTASPGDNAPITVLGNASTAYPQNIAFHKEAFTVAFAKLVVPGGVDKGASATSNDITVRYVRGFSMTNGGMEDRIDTFFGAASLYPEWGCRIYG